jgi:leucyl aminopeptidase
MARDARFITLANATNQPVIAVPVVFDGGEGYLAPAIPTTVGSHTLTHTLPKEWASANGLKSEAGSSVALRSSSGPTVVLVSVGESYNHAENWRRAGAGAARAAGEESVAFLLPVSAVEEPAVATKSLVEGALLASFTYKKDSVTGSFFVAPVDNDLPTVSAHDALEKSLRAGLATAEGVNWAKRLIMTPAGDLPPKELARRFESRLSNDPNVRVDVWNEKRVTEERLGGLLAVGAGSTQPVRFVTASYNPKGGSKLPHVALVGKGVCFDSGGLSLKPADSMMTMKYDMSGAAIVMAALSIVARLNLPVRVTAYAPLTENLPSGSAVKPGDVITIRNGKTVEVLNTDAEGRLILADALSLAVESNPDAIIDVATLTGAVRVALGEDMAALFASTDDLARQLTVASEAAGESLWRLPLWDGYESHIESDVADIKNIGKGASAGTISAALFLRHFTSGRPWAHLDIASANWTESPTGYQTKGAVAFSARTLVEFLARVARTS